MDVKSAVIAPNARFLKLVMVVNSSARLEIFGRWLLAREMKEREKKRKKTKETSKEQRGGRQTLNNIKKQGCYCTLQYTGHNNVSKSIS